METIPQEKPLRTVSGTSSLGSPTIVRGPLLTAFRSDVTGSASHHAITAPPRRRRLSQPLLMSATRRDQAPFQSRQGQAQQRL